MKSIAIAALKNVFSAIEALREAYPKKSFTIDGRFVGDIGEVLAETWYQLRLYDVQRPKHDAEASNGRRVQIKATFKDSLTFTSVPDYYIGLKLHPDGSFDEIYNGPGKKILERWKHRKGIGLVQLSFPIGELRNLSSTLRPNERIQRRR